MREENHPMGDASTVLNLATWQARSLSNGPGSRYVLWLQGCFRECPGCVNAPMQPHVIRHVRGVDDVAAAILAAPDIEGVTYSGGEPLEQVKPLVVLSRRLRRAGVSIVCYTGYTLQELQRSGRPDVSELLDCVDILIDGPFLLDQAACLLWRGSRNQQVHFVTRARARNPRDSAFEQGLWVVGVKKAGSRWSAFFSPSPPQPRVREVRGRKMLL
jgi:anaerobic ribonucleoside-triphosphate reductase activating protein